MVSVVTAAIRAIFVKLEAPMLQLRLSSLLPGVSSSKPVPRTSTLDKGITRSGENPSSTGAAVATSRNTSRLVAPEGVTTLIRSTLVMVPRSTVSAFKLLGPAMTLTS